MAKLVATALIAFAAGLLTGGLTWGHLLARFIYYTSTRNERNRRAKDGGRPL